MKQPQLKVIPTNNTKEDRKKAKIMSQIIDYHYKENKEFIDGLTRARLFIDEAYGIKTPDQPWFLILQVYLNKVMLPKKG